ncbi:hypothetical protein J1N35_005287 [Gossypium stocksii]|uniref:Uncharacterized protein n=1 Tax=Gossypium stocksii TaxID=47602 RepID=A0A9D3WDJ7_9ROSI|nr:hypothetical protein J1N35_005287 [Gossypium stocksii]
MAINSTPIPLLTPHKMGNFNLSHWYPDTPGIWTKEWKHGNQLWKLFTTREASSFVNFGMLAALLVMREKEEALKKILLLEKQLDIKQKLEMEIEDLKGKQQVMKHFGQDDTAVQRKMEEMNNKLQEKIDDLQNLDSTNKALIYKESQSNDELYEARKVLTQVLLTLSWLKTELCLPKPWITM